MPAPEVLRADDARWILALRAREHLQGGAAAVLAPESRAKLVDIGRRLGLRPFDTALIIAIVQDEARCAGSDRSEGAREGARGAMQSRLMMLPCAGHASSVDKPTPWFAWMAGAVVLAVLLALAGAAWLGG